MRFRFDVRTLGFVAAAALCASSPALGDTILAQTNTTDIPAREQASARQAAQAAQAAVDLRTVEDGTEVSYEDVLKDPDNLQLNFRFARWQVRRGDVRGAAATLERMLLVQPDLAPIRLFYGVVLYRLDNMDEAEHELKIVQAQPNLPADIRTEVDAYLSRIEDRRKRTRFTANFTIGAQYDSNRTAGPRSKEVLFLDIPIPTRGGRDDFAMLFIESLRVDHDLGYQEGHSIFAEASYYRDDQKTVGSQDLQSGSLEAGGVYHSPFWDIDIIPSGYVNYLYLSSERYMKTYGYNLRFERKFGPKILAFASTRLSYQQFGNITEELTANLRDGRQIEGQVGASWAFLPTMRVSGSYLHYDKNAKGHFFAYNRDELDFSHMWLLGGGQFMLNSVNLMLDAYDTNDPIVSAKTRLDHDLRYRLTYGAPLVFFFGSGTLPVQLEDITATASAEWFRAASDIPNSDYKNWKVQWLFSKTWQF